MTVTDVPDDVFGLIRLELTPHIEASGCHTERFDGWLGGQHVLTSRQPLYNGARMLLEMGADPDTLLTIRHRGKSYDSTKPLPIALLAKLTVEESDQGGLKLRKWRPFSGRSTKERVGAVPPTKGPEAGVTGLDGLPVAEESTS